MSQLKPLNTMFIIIISAIFVVACEDYDDPVDDGAPDDSYLRGLDTGETLYEAEKRTSDKNCGKRSKHDGFTGSGYMDFGGNGSWIEWNNILVGHAGEYTLTLRYASSSSRRASVIINGNIAGNVSFLATGGWIKWKTDSINVSLKNGENTIRVMANTRNGGPNLDNLVVTSKDVINDNCPHDPSKTEPGKCGCGTPEGTCGTDPANCKASEGCFQIGPTGTSDDSVRIQTALDEIEDLDGGKLMLKGSFVIARTVYLPSNLVWILDGKISLGSKNNFDKVIVTYNGVTNTKLTAITEKKNGATKISMVGGTYDGKFINDSGGKSIRFMNFARVTYSKFNNMIIENCSDDSFTLHAYSKYNEVRNLIARKSLTNGLNDKGEYNKWYDSIAEDCESDGWTPKCRNSEFHRCIARNNKGPGFGLYARIDGDITKGAVISGNKFFDCEAYNNVRAGMSFNIAEDRGPGAVIKDNYVQGKFYNNGMYGVAFRNKEPDGVVSNNEVDILAFGNKGLNPKDGSKIASGAGLRLDGEYISAIKGIIIIYDNSNLDMDLNDATNCAITVYNPDDQNPAELKTGSSTNKVTEKTFSCQNTQTTWSTKKYCSLP